MALEVYFTSCIYSGYAEDSQKHFLTLDLLPGNRNAFYSLLFSSFKKYDMCMSIMLPHFMAVFLFDNVWFVVFEYNKSS